MHHPHRFVRLHGREGWGVLLRGRLDPVLDRPFSSDEPKALPLGEWRYATTARNQDYDAGQFRRHLLGRRQAGIWRWWPAGPATVPGRTRVGQQHRYIWVRTIFNLKDLSRPLALRLSHDEDVEVYLNGTLVCQRKGYITDYRIHRLEGSAAAALRQGKNSGRSLPPDYRGTVPGCSSVRSVGPASASFHRIDPG